MPEITVQFPDGMTRTYTPETEEELFFGRDVLLGADVALASPLVSRRHAKIWVDGEGELRIEHVSKVNHSLVNDESITEAGPRLLADGDKITIQPFVLTVSREAGNGGPGSGESSSYHIGVSVSEAGAGQGGGLGFPAAPGVPGTPFGMVPGLPEAPGGLKTMRAPTSDDVDDSAAQAAGEPSDEGEAPSLGAEQRADAPQAPPPEESVPETKLEEGAAEAGPEELSPEAEPEELTPEAAPEELPPEAAPEELPREAGPEELGPETGAEGSRAEADEPEDAPEVSVPEIEDTPPRQDTVRPAATGFGAAESPVAAAPARARDAEEDGMAAPTIGAPTAGGIGATPVPGLGGEPEIEGRLVGGPADYAERPAMLPEDGQTTREPLGGAGMAEDDVPVSGRFRRMAASVMSRFSGDITDRDDEEVTARRPVEGMQPKLILRSALEGRTPNEQLPVYESPATVGSSDNCTITLEDRTVSDCHAELERVGLEWVVTDLQSTNGVFVNDTPIRANEPHPISDLDLIRFGTVEVQFVPEESHTLRVRHDGPVAAVGSGSNWRRKAIYGLLAAAALLVAALGVQKTIEQKAASAIQNAEKIVDGIKKLELVDKGLKNTISELKTELSKLRKVAPRAGARGAQCLESGERLAERMILDYCKARLSEADGLLSSDDADELFGRLSDAKSCLRIAESGLSCAQGILSDETAGELLTRLGELRDRRSAAEVLGAEWRLARAKSLPKNETEFEAERGRLDESVRKMEETEFGRRCRSAGYGDVYALVLGQVERRYRDFVKSRSYQMRAYEVLDGLLCRDLLFQHREQKIATAEEWFDSVVRSDLWNEGVQVCDRCSRGLMAFREAGAFYKERDYDGMRRALAKSKGQFPTATLRAQGDRQIAYAEDLCAEAAAWEERFKSFSRSPTLAGTYFERLRAQHAELEKAEKAAYLIPATQARFRTRRLALIAYYADLDDAARRLAEPSDSVVWKKLDAAIRQVQPAFDAQRKGLTMAGFRLGDIERAEREFAKEACPELSYSASRRLRAVAKAVGGRL